MPKDKETHMLLDKYEDRVRAEVTALAGVRDGNWHAAGRALIVDAIEYLTTPVSGRLFVTYWEPCEDKLFTKRVIGIRSATLIFTSPSGKLITTDDLREWDALWTVWSSDDLDEHGSPVTYESATAELRRLVARRREGDAR